MDGLMGCMYGWDGWMGGMDGWMVWAEGWMVRIDGLGGMDRLASLSSKSSLQVFLPNLSYKSFFQIFLAGFLLFYPQEDMLGGFENKFRKLFLDFLSRHEIAKCDFECLAKCFLRVW